MDKPQFACGRCFQLCQLCDERNDEAVAFNEAHPEFSKEYGYGFFTCDPCWECETQTHVPDRYFDTRDLEPPREIVLTLANIANWSNYNRALADGLIVADATGRLRYPHGAPVGKLVLQWITGRRPYYREATAEWFPPDSERARRFVWPD